MSSYLISFPLLSLFLDSLSAITYAELFEMYLSLQMTEELAWEFM
jgi:hypothetical protein